MLKVNLCLWPVQFDTTFSIWSGELDEALLITFGGLWFVIVDFYSLASSQNPKFVDLLNSQQDIGFGSYEDSVELSSTQVPFLATQGTADSAFDGDTPADSRERRTWTPGRTVVILQHLKQILRSVHRVLKPQRLVVRRRLIKRSK
uniref:Uncharacterized protein n=1 Tax=Brassica oleracea TaxID=3712 RepID=A0A3P6G5X5_BRAOL|nr:unnamed protein product [Brassica oleracea]